MRTGLTVIWYFFCATAVAGANLSPTYPEQPSQGLLEFLGELDPVDEQTWLLLEQNALKDAAKRKEVSSE